MNFKDWFKDWIIGRSKMGKLVFIVTVCAIVYIILYEVMS